MKPLQLSGKFASNCFDNFSGDEAAYRLLRLAEDGKDVPKVALEEVGKQIGVLAEGISQIDAQYEELQKMTVANELKVFNLNIAYWSEYYTIRDNLRITRLNLRKLAKETVIMCGKIKGYFEASSDLGQTASLKLQLTALERFITRAIPVLEEAEEEYVSAVEKLGSFQLKRYEFEQELAKMVNTKSAEYQYWTKKVRLGVYSGATVGTFTCIIPDAVATWGRKLF